MPKEDPRDPSLETKMTLPKTWVAQYPGEYHITIHHKVFAHEDQFKKDGIGAISMFLSGAVMVTRNRYLCCVILPKHAHYLAFLLKQMASMASSSHRF